MEDRKQSREIILFPDFAVLKAEVEKLRTELSMLLLEQDELVYVECKNIEMAYMLSLGNLEYQVYELHCAVLRLKRKTELIQELRDDIAKIKNEYPYTMKEIVQSEEKTAEKRGQLEGLIIQLKKNLEFYQSRIGEMLR